MIDAEFKHRDARDLDFCGVPRRRGHTEAPGAARNLRPLGPCCAMRTAPEVGVVQFREAASGSRSAR
jgi:hypothetical protein